MRFLESSSYLVALLCLLALLITIILGRPPGQLWPALRARLGVLARPRPRRRLLPVLAELPYRAPANNGSQRHWRHRQLLRARWVQIWFVDASFIDILIKTQVIWEGRGCDIICDLHPSSTLL